jgi:GT2 family glycosyltransferase
VDDLAIILISHHSERWLPECLGSVLEHRGDCRLDLVVVNNAEDRTPEVLRDGFPSVRLIHCENRGFAHANNQALATCDARYYLFLNADTRILTGTFEELIRALDERPEVGVAGVLQLSVDGRVAPTMRRFPGALRALGDALGAERLSVRPAWLGERDLAVERYDEEQSCDWMSGSFLLASREVLLGIGVMDERFFLYSEEPDLCLRARQGGWEIRHLPLMTIMHYGGNGKTAPRLAAQDAFSRMQFARKHFSRGHQSAYVAALGLGYSIRALAPAGTPESKARQQAARAAFRTLVGVAAPPFGRPPEHAMDRPVADR